MHDGDLNIYYISVRPQALLINSRNVNSLILKGTAFLELKKINEASVHFVEALRVAPHLYEAYKGTAGITYSYILTFFILYNDVCTI